MRFQRMILDQKNEILEGQGSYMGVPGRNPIYFPRIRFVGKYMGGRENTFISTSLWVNQCVGMFKMDLCVGMRP